MGYQLEWIFGKFAGNFGAEQDAYYLAGAEYNEAHGLRRGTLLSLVSCGMIPAHQRPVADENIRASRFFLLVAEDSWDAPPASFRHDYRLALQCKADPALPMREVAVLFRKPGEDAVSEDNDGRLAAFRAGIDPAAGVRQFDFADAAEFKTRIAALFSEWMAEG